VCLREDLETLFVWLWLAVEHGQSHETEAKAIDLRTIAAQLSCRERHCVFGVD
jgi:hypothetical protein